MKAFALVLFSHVFFNHVFAWKEPKPFNYTKMSANLDNPNFIRDRFKNEVYKPMMPTNFRERFTRPFAPAWMDYCDPYHCNDYHKVACGINRRHRVFKWFQSGCHILLNNECADFRGNLKYDQTDTKFCHAFILNVRQGCRDCEPDDKLVCAVSLVDNHVTLFRDRCALQSTNCESNTFDEYEEVDMGLCVFYLKEKALKINMAILEFHEHSARRLTTTMKISDRIALLKKQIRNSLRHPSQHDPIPDYYESDENAPIQPILDDDELKKDDRFKLPKIINIPTTTRTNLFVLRTRSTTEHVGNQIKHDRFPFAKIKIIPTTRTAKYVRAKTTGHVENKKLFNLLNEVKIPNIIPNFTPADLAKDITHFIPFFQGTSTTKKSEFNIFYRRYYDNNVMSNVQEWTHCVEHITPFLKGVKKELGRPKKIMAEDYIVLRLINLIRANTTKMTRAEKKTTMYQISKLKIHLYSWHLSAVMQLTTLIARLHGRSNKVDFFSLKTGILNMLAGWQADASNKTALLRQAKLYRPPCIPRGEQGSSKFVRGSTISTTPNQVDRFADDLDCRRRNADDVCLD